MNSHFEDKAIVLGDCLQVMQDISDEQMPLIIADPPYGIGYHSNHYKGRNPHAPVMGDWDFEIDMFLGECARIMKDGGALYLFCRWDVTPLWMPYIASNGLKLKTVIIWVKNNWSAGDLKGSFGNQYEQLMFIVKGRHLLRGKRWSNVWEFPRVRPNKMLHPTQKPVALVERAILASSDENDIVFDPFAGSGTTGEACDNTSRRYLLSDIDRNMVAIAKQRLGFLSENIIEESPTEPQLFLEFPTSEQWGIHPEELQAVIDVITKNIHTLTVKVKRGNL